METYSNKRPNRLLKILLIISNLIVLIALFILLRSDENKEYQCLYLDRFKLIYGLPFAIQISTILVLTLDCILSDPIEFNLFDKKNTGIYALLLLWLAVFLSIVIAIEILY